MGDSPSIDRANPITGDGTRVLIVRIPGLTQSAGATEINSELSRVDGLEEYELRPEAGTVVVRDDVDEGSVVNAIERTGYQVAHSEVQNRHLEPGMPTRMLFLAIVGAIATVFFWYVPLSPVLGGLVVGYLQSGRQRDRMITGALAGLLVPLAVLSVAISVTLLGRANLFGQWPFDPIVMMGISIASLIYSVGFGAVGGYISPYMEVEDIGNDVST